MQDGADALAEIVQLFGRADSQFPQSLKASLRRLVELFDLNDVQLLLIRPSRKRFSRMMQASSDALFVSCSCRLDEHPAGQVVLSGAVQMADRSVLLPLPNGDGLCAVLVLQGHADTPSSLAIQPNFMAVSTFLGGQLLWYEQLNQERMRSSQLNLLTELGAALSQAHSQEDLLATVDQFLLAHRHVACLILRPLYGETLLGTSQVRLDPDYRSLQSLFLELEEEHSLQVLKEESDRLLDGKPRIWPLPAPMPQALITIPLLFQRRIVGVLSMFGGEADGDLVDDERPDLEKFFMSIGTQVAHALERVTTLERLESLSVANERKHRETVLLYRISRAMHSTLRLNDLIHLILSAATAPGGGGFERAMLFMVNERSGILQGMLGVTRETAAMVVPPQPGPLVWERPVISPEIQQAQREAPFCRKVMKQRLQLDPEDNALAKAVRKEQVVLVGRPKAQPPAGVEMAESLELSSYACAPLQGRGSVLGVLVVDNPVSQEDLAPDRLRFLELFANRAGEAMENSMLLHRLETAHHDLRETQERLIQGEKLAVLGEMAASVTHELKNPLVAIGGFAKRLEKVLAAGTREQEYARIVAHEVARMEEMLSNILAFSKKQMLCFEACCIPEILHDALALEKDGQSDKNIHLVTAIDQSLPLVQGDQQKLRQVFLNILTNARQAMEQGGTLTVRAFKTNLRGDLAVGVEVEDTGGGIPDDILRNIFNPFFTTKEEGTGLGLSISHRIIELHKGEIEVQNRQFGTSFILRFPVGVPLTTLH